MGSGTVRKEIIEQLKILPNELQVKVLKYINSLTKKLPRGIPGRDLLKFAGFIPLDDLKLMNKAIKEDCERVNAKEW